MVWRGSERDPTLDPAASDVLAAYEAAGDALLICYGAGIEAWRGIGCTRIESQPMLRNRPWP